ncbi:MAG: threonine/serine exporter family protein, partial [Coriobacteriia bacterium]|nr:threonine/serine exporter family protein [Coriobacteriia bacterium]
EDTLAHLLDLGRAMLVSGADVNLVESWIQRLGMAVGAAHMNVFVITSSIVVTMHLPSGKHLTQTRRVTGVNTDFQKLEELHKLSLQCEAGLITTADLARRIDELDEQAIPPAFLYLGGILAAGGFAVFFGGTLIDGLVSAAFGVVICLMMQFVRPFAPNTTMFNYLASLVPGLGIAALCTAVPELHQDQIMMGDVMILIPGIAITNSLRDVLAGDTIAGILRLAESLLWATAMALGFITAMIVVALATGTGVAA